MRRLISNENNYNKLRTIVSQIVESVDLTIEPNNPEFYDSVQTIIDIISQYQDLNQFMINYDELTNLIKDYMPQTLISTIGYRTLIFEKNILKPYKNDYNFKKEQDIDKCLRDNIIKTRPVESWTKVKRYADIYEITSAQWKGKYNPAIHFPCRMSANVTGIFLPNVWKCLLQTFLTNDRQLFDEKVKGIDKEYDIEQEILCKGGNDYTIYNLKEIKKALKGVF